jgi:exonuclease SbcC
MSGDRYEFADLEDDAAPWMVIDNDNGRVRSPASLSGGEKFVASLALALGMVEMLGRAGGRLESLFLDEGFGALDRANLDAAIEALATVAASGRMVAVISHVRAVAEQVEHVLAVTREPKGSAVRWLDPAARRAVAGADLGLDASILGLLE